MGDKATATRRKHSDRATLHRYIHRDGPLLQQLNRLFGTDDIIYEESKTKFKKLVCSGALTSSRPLGHRGEIHPENTRGEPLELRWFMKRG